MATTFTRVDDSDALAGEATRITLNELGFFSLSAVRTGAGNLKLIGWSTGGATVSRLDDSANQAGEVSEIAMTRNLNRTVTAVRTGSGTLRLISWSDNSDLSNINRLKDSANQAGEATRIAIQPVGVASEADLVTACRTGAGILRLISWNLQSSDGTLTRLGDSQNKAGAISLVDLLTVSRNIVVTAVRNASGNLLLISWRISQDGTTFDRLDDSGTRAGEVSEIAIAGSEGVSPGSEGGGRVVTAVRDGSGDLLLISWDVAQDGTITRLDDSADAAGQATQIAISRFSASRYVTAVRTGSGNLRLIAWDVDTSSGEVTRTGDSANKAGAVSETALVTPPPNRLVTAVRDGGGNLKVITWNMQD
jgi:hypothetical protein